MKKEVPEGWKKGDPLVIRAAMVHGEKALYLSQMTIYNYSDFPDITPYAIAEIWFYSHEEMAEWLAWWYE